MQKYNAAKEVKKKHAYQKWMNSSKTKDKLNCKHKKIIVRKLSRKLQNDMKPL